MDREQLTPVANHLLAAYSDTADYSRHFKDHHFDMPPTVMAKAHHMRSVVQALIGNDENYRLSSQYAEMGRVLFTDLENKTELLLRSSAAQRIETLQTDGQISLGIKVDPVFVKSPVRLVVYDFMKDGLHLATLGTRLRGKRFVAAGAPNHVGVWPYVVADTSGDQDESFDQSTRDDFGEVGRIRFDEEEGSAE